MAAVSLKKERNPIKMWMTVVDGFKTKTIGKWAKRHLANGSAVISDELSRFRAVKVQLGKHDNRECAELAAEQLPYAWNQASTKSSDGMMLPI